MLRFPSTYIIATPRRVDPFEIRTDGGRKTVIVIYGNREHLDPIKARLSDVIHACMQTTLGLPEGKRAHRFMPMDAEDFYRPEGRTEAYTVIEINMMEGRHPETQKALIHALFSEIEKTLKIDPVDIEITIHEQPDHCWGFRGMTGDEARLDYKVKV